tara:strand:+ start:989 stop:1207 length:219 start_codon:yes stop_codon:yes gene_type:complete
MNIKTNKKIILLVQGLMALSAVDNPSDLRIVKDALFKAKQELRDDEILIAYYAFEVQKGYMDFLKEEYKKIN